MRHSNTVSTLICGIALSSASWADSSWQDTLASTKPLADVRLRYESHDSDNAFKTAHALTLRSRLGLESASVAGFTALVEIEDVRALIDDYRPENSPYDIVADPVNTEFNRVQLQYQVDGLTVTLGRQRIVLDNARFVGNVGWRQNEQTFDALRVAYQLNDAHIQYAFIDQVNDILFASQDVSHHLFNVRYDGLPLGQLTGYAYLLKDDNTDANNNTVGGRFHGKHAVKDVSLLYSVELATQQTDDFSANFIALEGGVLVNGVTLAIGHERLGSDDGEYGFQTPLATKHAFNGWADKFLGTPADGLTDTYLKVAGTAAGIHLLTFYHDYSADSGNADKGSEINLQATKRFNKHYSAGVKYANYRAGDSSFDTDKAWAWVQANF
ncbi:MAG: alginate export family protein [Bacterioplanes sp.]|nr:alginate export family protein [Bacterioplanes sp.]